MWILVVYHGLICFSSAWGAATVSTIHHFSPRDREGRYPQAGVTVGANGWLYGTTPIGGHGNQGMIYRVRPDGKEFAGLYHFTKFNGDGGGAVGALLQGGNGMLYGLTEAGGQNGLGSFYRLTEEGSNLTILRSFDFGNDGKGPSTGLIEGKDGLLYGTTDYGGAYSLGTVFAVAKDASTYKTLYSFAGTFTEGGKPQAALVQTKEGLLYGTTHSGGKNGRGTVFRLNPEGSDLQTLHHFTGNPPDGQLPSSALVEHSDGFLYGTTRAGGTPAQGGCIFRLRKDGADYQVVRAFTGLNNEPGGIGNGLVFLDDKRLLSTSLRGGQFGKGTLFVMNTDGTAVTVLHHFAGFPSDGAAPMSVLINIDKRTFFGTTERGGSEDAGTIYRVVWEE